MDKRDYCLLSTYKKSGFTTCAFCFANTHGPRKLNLVAPEIPREISYAIKRNNRNLNYSCYDCFFDFSVSSPHLYSAVSYNTVSITLAQRGRIARFRRIICNIRRLAKIVTGTVAMNDNIIAVSTACGAITCTDAYIILFKYFLQ